MEEKPVTFLTRLAHLLHRRLDLVIFMTDEVAMKNRGTPEFSEGF